jgi:hypothetical protein
MSEDNNSGASRIRFNFPGDDGRTETVYVVVPTRDVELYTTEVYA